MRLHFQQGEKAINGQKFNFNISWFIRLYDFYYLIVLKNRLSHSFVALTRSFNAPL